MLCIVGGLVAGVAYSLFVLATPNGSRHVSTGTLALPHAHFENDCGQCHADLTPISSDASKIDLQWLGVSSVKSRQHTEAACQSCHRVGNHHRADLNSDWKSLDQDCASCHADHEGRENDLTAVANENCTVCHSNLAATCSGESKRQNSISGFTLESHGEFRSLSEGNDSGRVKFDHAQHLLPGQVEPGELGPMKLSSLPATLRERYRKTLNNAGQSDDDLVQLQCNDCHTPSGNPDPRSTLLSDRELGRYFSPVSFEEHCQACHAIRGGVGTPGTTELPHAVAWQDLDSLLAANILGSRAIGNARVPGDDSQAVEKPGDGFGPESPPAKNILDPGVLIAARQRVKTECQKCHQDEDLSGTSISAALSGESEPIIPTRWLQHGLYDHGVHASIQCDQCHAGVRDLGDSAEASDQNVIMISNIESCVGCHRDPMVKTPDEIQAKHEVEFGGMPVWASSDCILCHRYHPTDPNRALMIQAAQNPGSAEGAE